MSDILIKNANLLDGNYPELRSDFEVLIKGNRIHTISDQPIPGKDALIIDAQGQTLMPGLIDAHVHITASKLDLANEDIPASEVAIQAEKFLEAMLQRGFTSVRDAGGADYGLAHAIEKELIKGPRLFYCGKALSQTGGHGDFRNMNTETGVCCCAHSASNISIIADGIEAVRLAARQQIRQGATHIKIMASGGVASPTDKISHLQYTPAEIKTIVEEANDAGIYVMAHAYTPQAIVRCIECGVRTIEHGNKLDEPTAALMAKHNVYLVPTLVIYEALEEFGPKLNLNEAALIKVNHVRLDGLRAIEIARAAGVKIGFGTDLLGVETQALQTQEFIIRSAVEQAFDTITSATLINGEILNQAGELGVLAPNAYADLILVNGNPLADIKLLAGQGEHLSLIMKDGKIYKNILST